MKTCGRIRHGAQSESDPNMVFWAYQGTREYWVTREKFNQLRERALANKKRRYHQNPEKFRLETKTFRELNPDKALAWSRKSDRKRQKTPARRAWIKAWSKKHRATNASYAISCRLRVRLATAIAKQRAKKSCPTAELLGCDWQFFLKWIEAKFSQGMSWDNRSQWHIDHIRPCCSYDLTNPEEQRKCFHYTNLQPLWATDNLSKNKYY